MANPAPEPPPDLHAKSLPLEILSTGTVIHRVHATAKNAKFFGWTGNWRFDSPDGSYGTLYAAMSEQACFVETLLRGLNGFVAQSELQMRSFCRFTAVRDIRLVPLYGPHMVGIGATAAVTSNPDYSLCQRWSQALHSNDDVPDGILYKSNYDNDELAVVLFDRAANAIDNGSSTPIMSDIPLLGGILNRYKASIR
jgi:RES domain-containing protein